MSCFGDCFVLSDIVFTHYAHHLPFPFILSWCSLVGMLQQIWFSICFLPWTYFSFYQYTGLCTTSGWGANLSCTKASFTCWLQGSGIKPQSFWSVEDLSTAWVAKFWNLCRNIAFNWWLSIRNLVKRLENLSGKMCLIHNSEMCLTETPDFVPS